MSEIDSEKLKAARDQLAAEREHLIEAAIEAGTAIRVGIAVTTHSTITLEQAKERKLAELRANGEKREIYFDEIVFNTGVPRVGDDDSEPVVQATDTSKTWKCFDCGQSFPKHITHHNCRPAPAPQAPPPRSVQAEPKPEAPRRYLWVQTSPAGEGNPGEIEEGEYLVEGDMVYVWDARGNHLGRLSLAPGEDPARAARSLLRDKTRKSDFNRSLPALKTYH
jgi:hypothetical protein